MQQDHEHEVRDLNQKINRLGDHIITLLQTREILCCRFKTERNEDFSETVTDTPEIRVIDGFRTWGDNCILDDSHITELADSIKEASDNVGEVSRSAYNGLGYATVLAETSDYQRECEVPAKKRAAMDAKKVTDAVHAAAGIIKERAEAQANANKDKEAAWAGC